jgi:DUF4097 and DUF4098 domain-containing protein YvlB
MKLIYKFFIAAIFGVSLAGCGSFWTPGVRVYDVETIEVSPNFASNLIVSGKQGGIKFVNADVENIVIVVSNYVDAGGYTYGENYLKDNTFYSVSTNTPGTISLDFGNDLKPDYWNIYGIGSDVTAYIPEGLEFNDLNIKTTTGGVDINISNPVEYLKVRATTGGVIVANSIAVIMDVKVTTGGLKIQNSVCEEINAVTTTGGLELKKVTANEIFAETTTGGLKLNGVVADKLFGYAEVGGISCDNEINVRELDLSVTTGGLNVKMKNAYTATLKSETGGINVDIISFGYDTANINVNSSVGEVKMNLSKSALQNVYIDAKTEIGKVSKEMDFSKVSEDSRSRFKGYNGNGNHKIYITCDTSGISINHR